VPPVAIADAEPVARAAKRRSELAGIARMARCIAATRRADARTTGHADASRRGFAQGGVRLAADFHFVFVLVCGRLRGVRGAGPGHIAKGAPARDLEAF